MTIHSVRISITGIKIRHERERLVSEEKGEGRTRTFEKDGETQRARENERPRADASYSIPTPRLLGATDHVTSQQNPRRPPKI